MSISTLMQRGMRELRRLLGRSADTGANNRDKRYKSTAEHIVIGGCGRSGTTLTRVILDSHPRICCGPESKLFLSDHVNVSELAEQYKLDAAIVEDARIRSISRGEFIDRFAKMCLSLSGKSRWAEKTPRNILNLEFIFRTFPHAKFIHVLRDGRDVACSLRTHPRHRVENGILVPLNNWRPIAECAARWRDDIMASKAYWTDPRFLVVRYEDLVTNPRATIERLLSFIGEEWHDAVLMHSTVQSSFRDPLSYPQNPEANEPIGSTAIGKWRQALSHEDKACFKEIAGKLLIDLGYATDAEW